MRAYHRVDPLMDERKSDYTPAQFGAFLKVQLLAGRQKHRGRFRSRAALVGALPAAYARLVPFLFDQHDLIEQMDGSVYVPGWDEWQEGDLTVRDRMARLRNKHRNNGVTSSSPDSNQPPAVTNRYIGVGVGIGVGSSGASAPRAREQLTPNPTQEGLPHLTPEVIQAAEAITGIGFASVIDKAPATELDRLVEFHGPSAVIGSMRVVAHGKRQSWPQVVYGARNRLEPIAGGPSAKEEREDREAREARERSDREYQRTQAYIREMQG